MNRKFFAKQYQLFNKNQIPEGQGEKKNLFEEDLTQNKVKEEREGKKH